MIRREILSAAMAGDDAPLSLRPRSASMMLDADYVLYACGLLGAVEPAAALAFGREALKSLDDQRTDKDSNHDATAAQ